MKHRCRHVPYSPTTQPTMLLSSPRWEAGVGAAEVQGAQRWYRYVSQGFLHFAKVKKRSVISRL